MRSDLNFILQNGLHSVASYEFYTIAAGTGWNVAVQRVTFFERFESRFVEFQHNELST